MLLTEGTLKRRLVAAAKAEIDPGMDGVEIKTMVPDEYWGTILVLSEQLKLPPEGVVQALIGLAIDDVILRPLQ